MTYRALLRSASQEIRRPDQEEEAIKLLLMSVSNLSPSDFYLALDEDVDPEIETDFRKKLSLYLEEDIPVQHLIGYAHFFGYPFTVNKDVLIPRPETEQLVESVLGYADRYFDRQRIAVLDLGTGSGCIGLTLALEAANMSVTMSDISEKALIVARKNRDRLKAKASIIRSDLFAAITGTYDIVVSNPPYIPVGESVQRIVMKEPQVALFGGLAFYQNIIESVGPYLNERALIAFEHGYQQKRAIRKIATRHFPDAVIIQKKDIQGKDRMTFIGIGGMLSEER
ncbi:MAG: peptide chain release factor N(5)-glutamine methyltransferase [Acholeplasmataceae bacterium]